MKASVRPAHRRMSAEDRRAEILEAAVHEFAQKGLHGTSTETIAHRVGVSQPYLFRLFGTKKELFLATVDRGFERVLQGFKVAAEAHPEDPLKAMGATYVALLANRDELLLQLQSYAACADPDVEELVRRRYEELYRYVERVSGASEEEVRSFFAHGMLLNVAAAMDLLSVIHDQDWIQRCLNMPG